MRYLVAVALAAAIAFTLIVWHPWYSGTDGTFHLVGIESSP